MWPSPPLRTSQVPQVTTCWLWHCTYFVTWSHCRRATPDDKSIKFLRSDFEGHKKRCCVPEQVYSDNMVSWWGRSTYFANKQKLNRLNPSYLMTAPDFQDLTRVSNALVSWIIAQIQATCTSSYGQKPSGPPQCALQICKSDWCTDFSLFPWELELLDLR